MRLRVVMLVVALVLGGLAAVMAVRYLDSARSEIEASGETVAVLVATQDIPRGMTAEELIARGILAEEEIPREWVSAGAVSSERAIEGQVLAAPLTAGEQVTRARFQYPDEAGLSYTVPEGYVAVAVANDEVIGVGGLIKPGDTVMVVATVDPTGAEGEPESRILLPSARVLAVGRSLGAEPTPAEEDEGQGVLATNRNSTADEPAPTTVTLAVTPADLERLVFASEKGTIWMALTAPTEPLEVTTTGRTYSTLFE